MSDDFTSVQWDKDDPEPHPIKNTTSSVIEEEQDGDEGEIGESSLQESSSIPPQTSPSDQSNSKSSDSDATSKYYIHSTVSEPLKETDGSNHYISYLIKTTSNNPVFQSPEFQIRRRFSDFNFLFQCLLNDFPTVIVPPLPNKQRLEYIKGDRFSDNFTTKRAISLNNFLSRVSKHETLRNSKIYHIFLENSDYWNTYKQNLKLTSSTPTTGSEANEKISDYIMNAFKKPTTNTENTKEFQEIITKANKLQENLIKIDRVYSKVLKKQSDLSTNFMKFGDEFVKLNRLINDNVEENTSDLDLSLVKNFKALSNDLHGFSSASENLTTQIDHDYLTSLKDLEHYIVQLKNSIKLKDSKLIDYEALTNYLNKANNEKQSVLHNGSGSATEATFKFLSRKLESITGTDVGYGSANSANNKILKLNSKIAKLEQEAQTAFEVFQNFEKQLLKEYYTKFEPIKSEEIDENLTKLAKLNLNFYNTVLKNWENLDDSLLSLNKDQFQSSLKLSEDSKFFQHDEVTKNEEHIKTEYDKLIKVHEERLKQKQQEAKEFETTAMETQSALPHTEDDELSEVLKSDDDDEEGDLLTASMLG